MFSHCVSGLCLFSVESTQTEQKSAEDLRKGISREANSNARGRPCREVFLMICWEVLCCSRLLAAARFAAACTILQNPNQLGTVEASKSASARSGWATRTCLQWGDPKNGWFPCGFPLKPSNKIGGSCKKEAHPDQKEGPVPVSGPKKLSKGIWLSFARLTFWGSK